ncbi:MAG: urease accessory protein UreD [Pseudomonadales bacterium]|jgi:urease accessory protein|nr:urease accessory protein UreD [Pseudomonadales bacterium]
MSPVPGGVARPQRTAGHARIGFALRDGRSVLTDLRQAGAARIRLPRVPLAQPPEAVFINTGGGLTGGDRMTLAIELGPGAAGCVTGQACEKIYRADADVARMTVTARLAAGAALAWIPQPAILFEGCAFERSLSFDLESGASLFALESSIFGRAAMGERLRTGRIDERWRVRRGGRLLWASEQRIRDPEVQLASPATFDGGGASATFVYLGEDVDARLESLRLLLEGTTARTGASVINGVLIGMLVARDALHLMQDLQTVIEGVLERPVPRVWTC